jgi:hypothetical protein
MYKHLKHLDFFIYGANFGLGLLSAFLLFCRHYLCSGFVIRLEQSIHHTPERLIVQFRLSAGQWPLLGEADIQNPSIAAISQAACGWEGVSAAVC